MEQFWQANISLLFTIHPIRVRCSKAAATVDSDNPVSVTILGAVVAPFLIAAATADNGRMLEPQLQNVEYCNRQHPRCCQL